ncbi:hypothetical protein IWX90DRAFT_132123 [Phyllosticta citrichinensis]|uniref:Uncharacterized protein n=1 Tax=Phyllosticta citrichinensis TaxID=1130410 RepID=A0ABR1Y4W2_9PEZI
MLMGEADRCDGANKNELPQRLSLALGKPGLPNTISPAAPCRCWLEKSSRFDCLTVGYSRPAVWTKAALTCFVRRLRRRRANEMRACLGRRICGCRGPLGVETFGFLGTGAMLLLLLFWVRDTRGTGRGWLVGFGVGQVSVCWLLSRMFPSTERQLSLQRQEGAHEVRSLPCYSSMDLKSTKRVARTSRHVGSSRWVSKTADPEEQRAVQTRIIEPCHHHQTPQTRGLPSARLRVYFGVHDERRPPSRTTLTQQRRPDCGIAVTFPTSCAAGHYRIASALSSMRRKRLVRCATRALI